MKKLICILLVAVLLIFIFAGCGGNGYSCEGCGNSDIGAGNYTFNYCHIFTDDEDLCFHIRSWHDSDVGIEVRLDDDNVLFISENRYLLSRNYCPICGRS